MNGNSRGCSRESRRPVGTHGKDRLEGSVPLDKGQRGRGTEGQSRGAEGHVWGQAESLSHWSPADYMKCFHVPVRDDVGPSSVIRPLTMRSRMGMKRLICGLVDDLDAHGHVGGDLAGDRWWIIELGAGFHHPAEDGGPRPCPLRLASAVHDHPGNGCPS